MGTTIELHNLPPDASEETVERLLSSYGSIQSIRIVRASSIVPRASHCIIEMRDGSRIEHAVRALDGQYMRGRLLSVEATEHATPRRAAGSER